MASVTGPARLPLSFCSQAGNRKVPADELSPLNSPEVMPQLATWLGFESWMMYSRPYALRSTFQGPVIGELPWKMLQVCQLPLPWPWPPGESAVSYPQTRKKEPQTLYGEPLAGVAVESTQVDTRAVDVADTVIVGTPSTRMK